MHVSNSTENYYHELTLYTYIMYILLQIRSNNVEIEYIMMIHDGKMPHHISTTQKHSLYSYRNEILNSKIRYHNTRTMIFYLFDVLLNYEFFNNRSRCIIISARHYVVYTTSKTPRKPNILHTS